jgi:hypothetical protein
VSYLDKYPLVNIPLNTLENGVIYIVPHVRRFIVCRVDSIFMVFNPYKDMENLYNNYFCTLPTLTQTVYKTELTIEDIGAGLSGLLETGD